jgi:hypothetical protein
LSNSAEFQPDPASSESECVLKDPKPLLLSQNRRVPKIQHPAEILLQIQLQVFSILLSPQPTDPANKKTELLLERRKIL